MLPHLTPYFCRAQLLQLHSHHAFLINPPHQFSMSGQMHTSLVRHTMWASDRTTDPIMPLPVGLSPHASCGPSGIAWRAASTCIRARTSFKAWLIFKRTARRADQEARPTDFGNDPDFGGTTRVLYAFASARFCPVHRTISLCT